MTNEITPRPRRQRPVTAPSFAPTTPLTPDQSISPDYEVGYGKPPKDTRFKPGVSGNPRGKPRGAKSMKTIVREALNEKIDVNIGGKQRRITKREVLIRKQIGRAAEGDAKAFQLVNGLDDVSETAIAQDELSDAQKARLRDFLNPPEEMEI